MHVHRHLVTPAFRAQVRELLPGLDAAPGYWALFGNVVFGGYHDPDSRQPIVSRDYMAAISGLGPRWKSGRGGSAWDYLDEYSRLVHPVQWSDPDNLRGLSRRIMALDVPERVQALVDAEMGAQGEEWAFLDDGRRWTRTAAMAENVATRGEAQRRLDAHPDHPAYDLASFLNSQPSNSFSKVRSRLPEAHRLVDELGLPFQHHAVLRAIRERPQPMYAPSASGDSCRLYPTLDGVPNLRRELRTVVCQGWVEADLRSAQLAICSAPAPVGWDVPDVREFLSSGVNVWRTLADGMDLELKPDTKSVLKDALYGVCYGQGDRSRTQMFGERLPGLRNANQVFKRIPIVRTMLHARADHMRKIVAQGGAYDAFDRWIPVSQRIDPEYPKARRTNVPSICSLVAQSWELRLLLPVLDLARSEEGRDRALGFAIMNWQHDGFAIHSQGNTRAKWRRRIAQAVDGRASSLCVPTRLEWAD